MKPRKACMSTAALFAVMLFLARALFPAVVWAEEPQPDPAPAQLKAKTLEAFDHYVQLTQARHDDEVRHPEQFLWVDALPEAQRQEAYAQLRQGLVTIERLHTLDHGKPIRCPNGLIHHWVAVLFIPGATLEQTLSLVKDYDHHSTYYAPDVRRSKILEHLGDEFKVFLRFQRKKLVTVVLNTEHEVRYFPVDATRAHSRSVMTRVAKVENNDMPDEREKPAGQDGGYLWGMNNWWRFVQRDGGTYVQCESASLTRDIPAGLGWLIGPFVNSIPRETLTATLNATRNALTKKTAVSAAK